MRTVHLESISTNQFKSNVKPYLNDKSFAKRLQALVRTANCIMNDVQIPNIYVDIVKISDTRNDMQKLHINYILQLLSNNKYYENLLVLNTNTILKDLGDSKTDLVAVALDFVGQTRLLDEYILRYFVKLANSNEVIRNLVAKNIHQFFDNPEYVKMFGLKKLLAEMCDDANNLWALNSAYILMPEYDVLDENDILGMYMCAGLERKILYLMILNKKIEHNRFDPLNYDKLKSICYNNLDSCITELTYLSSKILLAIDNEHAQYIYNTLLSYANDNDLNSYLILEFIRDMIAKQKEYDFTYENSDFVIFKTETYDIKKIKLDIMCHRQDSFSLQEILYCKDDNELIHDVLYIILQKNICEPELLKICCKNDINKTIEVIKHSCPLSEDWKTVIKNNFCIFRDFDAKLDDVVCIASEVGIDCGTLFGNDLTLPQKYRVYSSMFKSDCIIKEEFLAKLNWKEDVNDRFDYKNSQSVMSPNLLASNLFDGYRFVHCCDTKNLPLVTQTTNNVTQTKAILYEYIDPDVSFNIELGDNTLVFNIIRIETDTHICIQDYINRKFSKKYKEVIKNLTIYDLPLTLAIAVNGTNRTLDITALDLLLPHSSDIKTFNEKFCSLKYYEIISANKYNYEKYKIDSKLFACTLMDYVIYGMEMCGQIIIKSDEKDALKTFISALE